MQELKSTHTIPTETPKKMGKGKAYTAAEDQHLCTAWVATSEDPITGTGQKKDAFWKSIMAAFSAYLDQGKIQEH